MAAIQDFVLRIKTEGQEKIKQVNDQVKNLTQGFNTANTGLGNLGNGITNLVGKLGPLASGISAVAAAIATLATRGIQLGDELGDLSDATNISAGSLQSLKNSIIEAGGKADDYAKIAAKLNQSVQAAAGGNEEFQNSFKKLGVFVTDSNGQIRSTEAILNDLTDRFREGRLTGDQYSSAIKLLGESINRLDLTKLSAAGNAITDQQVSEITRMTGEIDKLRQRFDDLALSIGGAVAAAANRAFEAYDRREAEFRASEREANLRGRTRLTAVPPGQTPNPSSRLPFGMTRAMTPQEIAAFQESERIRRMDEATSAYRSTRSFGAPGIDDALTPGGFGQKSEAQLRAEREHQQRLELLNIDALTAAFTNSEARKVQAAKLSGDQIRIIETEAYSDIEKLRRAAADKIQKEYIRLSANERLTDVERFREIQRIEIAVNEETGARIVEISTRTSQQIEAIRKQQLQKQIDAFLMRETEREQNRQDLAAFEDARNAAIKGYFGQVDAIRESRAETKQRFDVELQIASLSDREQNFRRRILELELQRQKAVRDLGNVSELTAEDRIDAEMRINKEFKTTMDLLAEQEGIMRRLSESFNFGWERAFENYAEQAQDNAKFAYTVFETATRGMEDAIVRFAQTGKISFRDMTDAIIADIIRIMVRRSIVSFMMLPAFSGFNAASAAESQFALPGRANGGLVVPNRAYVVGEAGPEMFIPQAAGNIVPNNRLQNMSAEPQMITYNINAVDAASFRSLVARDPSFIHAVAERGRSSQPSRRA